MAELDQQSASSRSLKPFLIWGPVLLGTAYAASLYPDQAVTSTLFVIENLIYMAPIVAIAVMASGLVRATGADAYFNKLFEGRLHAMILAAAAFGAVAPICGIGVLPLIAGLLATGIPVAPVMAFWLASPVPAASRSRLP